MQESVDVALANARIWCNKITDGGSTFFEDNLIHLHVPEGATPKDGPSAGVTMTTALLSLATGRPVLHDLAMTGEITLTGKVMKIGGVREKTIAALRSGAKILIFPFENKSEYEELPEYIRNDVKEVYFVNDYQEVYDIAFREDDSEVS